MRNYENIILCCVCSFCILHLKLADLILVGVRSVAISIPFEAT